MGRLFTAALMGGILVFSAVERSAAQTSLFYLTAGDQGKVWAIQNGTVIDSWSAVSQYEYAIAVSGTVRTLNSHATYGHEYTLDGTATGVSYTEPAGLSYAWDGATDGTSNYVVDFGTGTVIRTSSSWQTPTALFTLSTSGSKLGITHDRSNNSLWIADWGGGAVRNYSMDGTLLFAFSTVATNLSALALDYADGSLWMFDRNTISAPTFYQYSRAGARLSTMTVSALAGQNILGGEFAVPPSTVTPEPISMALLGTGLAGVAGAARRRRRRQEEEASA